MELRFARAARFAVRHFAQRGFEPLRILLPNKVSVPLDVWYSMSMIIEFSGKIFHWRGPAPFLFVAVPEEPSRDLKAISAMVTYGWGVIPVHARIGKTEWKTSLFPKDGRYLVPIKMSVQKSENLKVDDDVVIQIEVS